MVHKTFSIICLDRKPASFITRGVFGYHIRHWFQFFPRNQILFLNEFDLKFNPWKVIDDIQSFANVDHVISQQNFWKNEVRKSNFSVKKFFAEKNF